MKLSNSKLFLYSCISFVAGIAVASFLPSTIIKNDILWFSLGALCLVLAVFLFFFGNQSQNKKSAYLYYLSRFFLFTIFFFLAIWRYSLSIPADSPRLVEHYNEQSVKILGVIVDDPEIGKRTQKLRVDVRKLQKLDRVEIISNIEGVVLVTTSVYPEFEYGDRIELVCNLKTPEEYNGFAYDKYLGRFNIYSVCFYPKKQEKIPGERLGAMMELKRNIFRFKEVVSLRIKQGLPEPESSLARAMILGDKKAIGDDLRETFARVGLSHIVAISGMHIGIIALIFAWILYQFGLWRKHVFYLSCIFLIIYVVMIGAPASAVRAAIMGIIIAFGFFIGRVGRLENALIFALSIMLIFNPKLLRYDIGFQLSFLALFGIVYAFPFFEKYYLKVKHKINPRNNRYLKIGLDIVIISIIIQLVTMPVIIINFKQISLISPIANLFVLWILPLLISALLVAIALSLVLPSFSFLFFLPILIILKYIIFIAEVMSKLPFSYIGL